MWRGRLACATREYLFYLFLCGDIRIFTRLDQARWSAVAVEHWSFEVDELNGRGTYTKFQHYCSYRSRQDDAVGPVAASHRHDSDAGYAGSVAGFHGSGTGARDHDQGPSSDDGVQGAQR